MKYLVEINSPKARDRLVTLVGPSGKVGKASAILDVLIVDTDQPIENIRGCTGVGMVEADCLGEPLDVVNQLDPPGWALKWMSDSDDRYTNQNHGSGVDLYILDSGIRDNNVGFAGRIETLYSFDGQPWSWEGTSPGHGTGVAGCAAGTTFGTSKGAHILNCRSDFWMSTNIKALDKILRHHLDKPDDRPSVLNFSAAAASAFIGAVFEKMARYGIVVVAAAGNSSGAEPLAPASNKFVVSVGALNQAQEPAWFTNRKCDIYAPGQDVHSLSVFSSQSTPIPMSGTSFAAPYVSGLFCALLEGSDKFNSKELVKKFTDEMLGQVMDTGRIPNGDNGEVFVTANSKGIGGVYYTNPSKAFTNEEIRAYLMEHTTSARFVADICQTYNVSQARLSAIATPIVPDVNQYFIDNGVRPWWFT